MLKLLSFHITFMYKFSTMKNGLYKEVFKNAITLACLVMIFSDKVMTFSPKFDRLNHLSVDLWPLAISMLPQVNLKIK